MAEARAFCVHWDAKLLQEILPQTVQNMLLVPELREEETIIERLPVMVSYDMNEQLLGLPEISPGEKKGERVAEAVNEVLKDWKIVDRVQAISFDTTSIITGPSKGAPLLLEKLLGRKLLYMPCRHHIYDMQLREVIEAKLGKISDGSVPIFDRFREAWSEMKGFQRNQSLPGIIDDTVAAKIPVGTQEDVKSFCKTQLKIPQPSKDHKEFLQMILLFLGGEIPNYRFSSPGLISNARLMAKAIFCIKIFLFRKYVKMSPTKLDNIRDVCIYIVTLYVKAWLGSTKAVEAPNQDWEYLKAATRYTSVDHVVSERLVKHFCGQLWYLGGEAIALALYDNNVPSDVKLKISEAIRKFQSNQVKHEVEVKDETEEDSDEEDGAKVVIVGGAKRIELAPHQVHEIFLAKDLSFFVTVETGNFFKRFGLSTDFIGTEPDTWPQRDDYQAAREFVQKLHVISEVAERGERFLEEYNRILSRNESERRYLLQVASRHRQLFPLQTP